MVVSTISINTKPYIDLRIRTILWDEMMVGYQTEAMIMSTSSLPNFPSLILTRIRALTHSRARKCSGNVTPKTRDALVERLMLERVSEL